MKIKTKKCETGALMLQLGGNTIHSIYRKRDRSGTWYESDRFTGAFAGTITEAKTKTEEMIRAGRLGDHFKELLCS